MAVTSRVFVAVDSHTPPDARRFPTGTMCA
jgi:hypothetical protein